MADDKRDGADDLFEDLDKFFAPIQDVEWPEPEAPDEPPSVPPAEEHVEVHAEVPQQPESSDLTPNEAEPDAADEPVVVGDDHGDVDAAWYDTSVMETIEDLGAPGVEGQASLLGGQDDADEGGLLGDEPDVVMIDAGDIPPVEPSDQPSEAEVEAAAEHFASSVRGSGDDPAPMPFDDVDGVSDDTDDLFGDIASAAGSERMDDDRDEGADILADLEEPPGAPRTVKVGSEGMGGPSWQDPTSVEVGADIDRRGPGAERDVPAAFLTGLILAGIALGALLIADGLFALLAAVVVVLAQGELYGVLHRHHQQPATAVGLATGVLTMGAAYYRGEGAMLAMTGLGTVATFLWFMAVPAAHRKNLAVNIGLTLMGIVYIPLLAGYLILMLKLGDGTSLVVAVIALTLVFDTSAFLGGSVFGGVRITRPLAPATSPKKSWEGTIIATLITVIVSVAFVTSFVEPLNDMRLETLMLGIVVAVAATFGDLAESLLKRDVGIKDMSSMLPGHGGVLDRIDSLLFVAPAAFLLLRVIFA